MAIVLLEAELWHFMVFCPFPALNSRTARPRLKEKWVPEHIED